MSPGAGGVEPSGSLRGSADTALCAGEARFNLGVEVGQLLAVALAFVLVRAFSRSPAFVAGQVPALYAMGGTAAYWTWGRIAAILG